MASLSVIHCGLCFGRLIIAACLIVGIGAYWLWASLPARRIFFWAPVSINTEKRCNHYRLIVACMLSGASRHRPVIVGWSTALRGQVINESLGQRPKKLAAGPRLLARTESSRSLCERRSLPVDPDAAKSAPAVDESAMVHLPVLGGRASGHSPWSSGRQASSAGMVASCL